MKKVLLFILIGHAGIGFSQTHHTLPPEASAFYDEAQRSAKRDILVLVRKKSEQLAKTNINSDSLFNALKQEPMLTGMSPESRKAISLLILVECSYKTDAELKRRVLQIQKDDKGGMDFENTAPILERKSMIAEQVSKWLRQMDDQTAALKNLQ